MKLLGKNMGWILGIMEEDVNGDVKKKDHKDLDEDVV